MSRINTNVPALQAINRLGRNNLDLNVRLERLGTGLRINRGSDDPAGLIASETLRAEINGIRQAITNSSRGINVISTAEGALNEVSALLLDLRALLVSTANEGALTGEEVDANQLEIDALLASVDRIANTTTFGGLRLLDGSRDYTTSSIDTTDLASVKLFAARVPENATRNILVQLTNSAETGNVSFAGAFAGTAQGAGVGSFTSATTIEIAGSVGSEVLSFASGTTLTSIRDAINDVKLTTGVTAFVSTTAAVAGIAATSSLVVNSTSYGSAEFVTIKPISGNFVENGNSGTINKDFGVDAGVVINGQTAASKGLRVDLNSNGLDLRLYLTETFGNGGDATTTTSFQVTGGGSIFQVTSKVTPLGQINVGIGSVSSANLGNNVVGFLSTIGSGGVNEVRKKNFITAQGIISEAINQVAVLRGRLGSLQKNQFETNIRSQQVALENVTAAESSIRDADMAAEVAALTRAQILVQSTQATLQIATNAPTAILSLLG